MVKLNGKIKSATLVEALVAMVILMICFSISFMIYLNVSRSYNLGLKLNALLIINEISEKTKEENTYLDKDYNFENMRIEKRILPYTEGYDDIRILEITASNRSDSVILAHKELVLVK